MSAAFIEHVNVTVSDPKATAEWLCKLFNWQVRWQGTAIHDGHTIHVGSETSYLAIYSLGHPKQSEIGQSYTTLAGLNHIGIVVDDLDKAERNVKALGFTPHSHATYEPGKRFYFRDHDGIEFEVISYG
jgi:glyoxylase I family protein